MQGRNGNYLRRQAEVCIALSRSTFDLALAARLRALAEDLRTKAVEWDAVEWDDEGQSMPAERPLAGVVSRA